MSPRDDDREDREVERPKRSWREIDQMRDGTGRRDDGPRGAAAEARSRGATREYLKQLDGMFSATPGGSEGAALARSVRDAHGTPGFADACRAYIVALGPPKEVAVASLMLDAGDRELVLPALEGLAAAAEAGGLTVRGSLRTQLQLLAEDPDDDVAYGAEQLLER